MTATPPRADLRTLAAEARRRAIHAGVQALNREVTRADLLHGGIRDFVAKTVIDAAWPELPTPAGSGFGELQEALARRLHEMLLADGEAIELDPGEMGEDLYEQHRQTWRNRAAILLDMILAAVLPEHRRMVLGEAADELTPLIEWQRRHYGDDTAVRDRVDWIARGRLFGMEDAQATIRLLAAAAPPAGLSATVPAGNAPAVPEGGMGACDRCTGLFLPGDKIAYDADGQYHAEHFPAVPEEADGQRAGQDDALTYAEMESERDRLAGEVFALTNSEALAVVAAELERDEVTADRDRLAAQVERVRAIHTEFDGRCAECVDYCDCIDRVTELGDDVEVAAAMRMCEHGNKPWPCPTIAAVDALPDAGTQPCPTPSDAKSGTDQTEDDHD